MVSCSPRYGGRGFETELPHPMVTLMYKTSTASLLCARPPNTTFCRHFFGTICINTERLIACCNTVYKIKTSENYIAIKWYRFWCFCVQHKSTTMLHSVRTAHHELHQECPFGVAMPVCTYICSIRAYEQYLFFKIKSLYLV